MSSVPANDRPLACHYHPCTGHAAKPSIPIVLLHGWGCDSRIWRPLLAYLQTQFEVLTVDLPGFGQSATADHWQHSVEHLAAMLPECVHIVGWSLGGMIATQYAGQYPQRVKKLITLATNARFVANDNWPLAMTELVFDGFYQLYSQSPKQGLRQFTALEAKGDQQQKATLKELRALHQVTNALDDPLAQQQAWLAALGWLRELDNLQCLPQLNLAQLHCFGEHDALVPVAAAHSLPVSLAAHIKVFDGCGHAPHISQPEQVATLWLEFLLSSSDVFTANSAACKPADNPYAISKLHIASSFGKAASHYDAVAQLQRQVGDELMALVSAQRSSAELSTAVIADMGCGTGYFSQKLAGLRLAEKTPRVIGVDIAQGMLDYAAEQCPESLTIEWLCADAEATPLADNSIDLIFSNFAFQWCQDLPRLMAEQYRLLSAGGVLVFSSVGPKSLHELRHAWQAVDNYVHVNRFTASQQVEQSLLQAGFTLLEKPVAEKTRYYRQLSELTRELKHLGAHNMNAGRKTSLTSRQQIAALKAAYEQQRVPEGLPASWDVLYYVAEKPPLIEAHA